MTIDFYLSTEPAKCFIENTNKTNKTKKLWASFFQ